MCQNIEGFLDSPFMCVYDSSSREISIQNQFPNPSFTGQVSFKVSGLSTPTEFGV